MVATHSPCRKNKKHELVFHNTQDFTGVFFVERKGKKTLVQYVIGQANTYYECSYAIFFWIETVRVQCKCEKSEIFWQHHFSIGYNARQPLRLVFMWIKPFLFVMGQ